MAAYDRCVNQARSISVSTTRREGGGIPCKEEAEISWDQSCAWGKLRSQECYLLIGVKSLWVCLKSRVNSSMRARKRKSELSGEV